MSEANPYRMSVMSINGRGSAGLPVAVDAALTAELRHCNDAEAEHAENRRQYAHTFHYSGTICLVDAFWRLPAAHRDGIILHEFGHLVAGPAASESAADKAIEELTGVTIRYVSSRYGEDLEMVHGSVVPEVEFDSKAGRGSANLPIASRSAFVPVIVPRVNITDRALRYRANEDPPVGPKVCCYCGSERYIEIDHINGFEEDTSPENLAWACRRCNTLKGIAFANSHRGRRTAQYNPTKSGGAATIGEWVRAVACIIPHKGARYSGESYGLACQMSVSDAVEMVRATPQWRRQEYGAMLQSRKSARGRASEVPF